MWTGAIKSTTRMNKAPLLALVVGVSLLQVKGQVNTTCIEAVVNGQTANLTFHFEEDIRVIKSLNKPPEVLIQRQPLSTPKESIAICHWYSELGELACLSPDKITYDKDRMTIFVVSVSWKNEDTYFVSFDPPVPGFNSSCILKLKDDSADTPQIKDQEYTSGKPIREQKEEKSAPAADRVAHQPENLSHPLWAIVIILSILLLIFVPVAVLYMMRRVNNCDRAPNQGLNGTISPVPDNAQRQSGVTDQSRSDEIELQDIPNRSQQSTEDAEAPSNGPGPTEPLLGTNQTL